MCLYGWRRISYGALGLVVDYGLWHPPGPPDGGISPSPGWEPFYELRNNPPLTFGLPRLQLPGWCVLQLLTINKGSVGGTQPSGLELAMVILPGVAQPIKRGSFDVFELPLGRYGQAEHNCLGSP